MGFSLIIEGDFRTFDISKYLETHLEYNRQTASCGWFGKDAVVWLRQGISRVIPKIQDCITTVL